MKIAANADEYTVNRLNIFFPGIVPSLDGQCVSLVKWFMQEMSEVPDPQAARGDARYVGKTLVAQGHAREVAYSERKRGDIICYEYGTYGHIGVVLSGDRTFEENVNWSGVASKIVDGARVYASRIGQLSESWRHDQHIYRLNSYKEGEEDMYPTESALTIAGRQTGFGLAANGNLEPNFKAFWTTGTSNPDWSDPNLVLAKLIIEAFYAGRKEGQGQGASVQYEPVTDQLFKKKG